ncbi:MAG TPA: V-type ATP synthase subunit D [bacterium]|nr:V-type ATP synthase subunit D [bacterium]HOV22139.1 V-type ATP synthase subunit D [bacterium]HRR95570.1 V-type ATP synthase subunit D [Candidatus Ratteibacteria bacterium]
MRIQCPATKTNLLKMKKALLLTEEGYQLLEEKRKIIMNALTGLIHIIHQSEEEVATALKEGYNLVDKTICSMGRKKLEEISFSINIQNSISISHRKVMGVSLPDIKLDLQDNPPYYSPYEVSLYTDEVIEHFKKILSLLVELAEKRIALLRLAKEMQKTMRKVNALEKVYIPAYRETVKYIGDRLDEESRDAFSLLKLIKQRHAGNRVT